MNIDFQQIMSSVQNFFTNLPDNLNNFYQKTIEYFKSLSLYEAIAWGGNGIGLILVIVALVLW